MGSFPNMSKNYECKVNNKKDLEKITSVLYYITVMWNAFAKLVLRTHWIKYLNSIGYIVSIKDFGDELVLSVVENYTGDKYQYWQDKVNNAWSWWSAVIMLVVLLILRRIVLSNYNHKVDGINKTVSRKSPLNLGIWMILNIVNIKLKKKHWTNVTDHNYKTHFF